MRDFLFKLAEQQHFEPPPQHCPVCGSIDISAGGICRHCNTNIELEVEHEKCKNVG